MQWTAEPDTARLNAVVDLARRATALHPEDETAWRRYFTALVNAGGLETGVGVLTEGIARHPTSVVLRTGLVRTLLAAGQFEQAVAAAREACDLAPGDIDARQWLFEALVAARKGDEVKALVEGLAQAKAQSDTILDLYAKIRGPEKTIALCDRYLEQQPGHTDARYQKAVALAQLGRGDEARALMAAGTISISEIALPPGYDSIAAFNSALEREIRGNPTLKPDPRAKATRGGLQTERLVQPDNPAVGALLAAIRGAVDAYEARHATSSDPLFAHRPAEARLMPWAVIYGRDGRQVSHRHPSGWISGVYYVAAPREGGRNAYQGPMLLGALDRASHGVDAPWEVRDVEPIPGRLLLFPSFMPHATESTGVDGARISVAFDVVPKN